MSCNVVFQDEELRKRWLRKLYCQCKERQAVIDELGFAVLEEGLPDRAPELEGLRQEWRALQLRATRLKVAALTPGALEADVELPEGVTQPNQVPEVHMAPNCVRCHGSGEYAGKGVCYRCAGRGYRLPGDDRRNEYYDSVVRSA